MSAPRPPIPALIPADWAHRLDEESFGDAEKPVMLTDAVRDLVETWIGNAAKQGGG